MIIFALTHSFDRSIIFRWEYRQLMVAIPTIRIANKHLVDGLHRYLAQKVDDDWPLTLQDWDTPGIDERQR